MKKIFRAGFFVILFGIVFIPSCSKKVETPVVAKWISHHDPYLGFEIQYPDGWLVNADPKKMKIYSSQDVANTFFEINSNIPISGEPKGVEIEFGNTSFKDEQVGTVADYQNKEKTFIPEGINITDEKAITFGKENGVEFSYSIKIASNATISIREIIVARDSVFYYLKYSGLNDYFTAYAGIFDSVMKSVKLPRPKIKGANDDELVKPSAEITNYSNEFFSIDYPENFESSNPAKKGETINAVDFVGYRQDCTIQVDVLPAKGLTVEKVFEQNKGKFNAKSDGSVTIDGNSAKYLNYSPVAKIDRRVYFVVKNDKVYRIFLTWFTPMEKDFKPAFEKVVSSFKIK